MNAVSDPTNSAPAENGTGLRVSGMKQAAVNGLAMDVRHSHVVVN